jgi:hypothetical protein
MSKRLLIPIVSLLLILCVGCKKTGTANTGNWVGSYTTPSGPDTLNNITISASGDNLLRLDVKASSGGYIYTYTTLQRVAISNPTNAVINESANLTGSNGLYNIRGNLTLSSTTITLTATATQGTDVKNLNFTGRKQ